MTVNMVNSASSAFLQKSDASVSGQSKSFFENILNTTKTEKASAQKKDQVVKKGNTVNTNAPVKTNDKDVLDSGFDVAESVEETKNAKTDNNMDGMNIISKEDNSITESEQTSNEFQPSFETKDTKLPDELLSEILSVLNQITVMFQEFLSVSEEQLIQAADELMLQPMDLLKQGTIQDLFLKLNGFEAKELISNEDLFVSLGKLQEKFNEILLQSDLQELALPYDLNLEQLLTSSLDQDVAQYIMKQGIVTSEQTVIGTEKELVIRFEQDSTEVLSDTDSRTMVSENEIEQVPSNKMENGTTNEESRNSSSSEQEHQNPVSMFLQRLVQTTGNISEVASSSIQEGTELYDIATQIIEQVKLQVKPDTTKMEIQLNPEHLGKVDLEISSKNGELSAKLKVENRQVKEALESQMQILQEALETQGLRVENIEVSIFEFGFHFEDDAQNGQQYQNQKQRSKTSDVFDVTDNEEQGFADAAELMKEMNGNSVDYVA